MNSDSNSLLAQLVAFPSVSNDPAAKKAAIQYVAHYLEKRGMQVTLFDWEKDFALVASTRLERKTPIVTLAGHLDVVPGSRDMFKVRAENGRLYGRGTYDMKFAITSYLQVVDTLQDSLEEYDFSIMLVTDEESAGSVGLSGTKQLIDMGYIPQMAIIPDGGRDWQLETFAKGFMHYGLQAHGKTAHGSRPWEGDNALLKLISLLSELKDNFKGHGPDTDTLNIGIIKSGEAVNKIPDFAEAEIEMRLNSLGSLTKRSQMVEELCARHGVTSILRAAWEPTVNDLENPFVHAFAQCIEEVVGVKNKGFRSFGGSDARFFAMAGVPYGNFYPFGGGHHSAEEWIAEDTVEKFTEVLLRYLRRTAHTTSADEQVALAAEATVDNTGQLE